MGALIRLATPDDAKVIAAIYAPFCTTTPTSFEETAPTAEEMAQRIDKGIQTLPWLVLETYGRVAGYVYAAPHRTRAAYRWSVDVTVYVDAPYQRRGIGLALYTSLFGLLVVQGYFKAYAGITLPNPASVRLHQAVGFEPVGLYRGVGYKLGSWHDVQWFQLALQPERPEPEPPQAIGKALLLPGCTEALASGLARYRSEEATSG